MPPSRGLPRVHLQESWRKESRGIGGVAVLSASAFCLVINLFGRQGSELDALRAGQKMVIMRHPMLAGGRSWGHKDSWFQGVSAFLKLGKEPRIGPPGWVLPRVHL